MKIFIKGKPALFTTNLEKKWKEKVREQIQIKSLKDNNDRGIILKFYLNSFTHNGQPFDLDNIVEYVFSVLINKKGYFNGKRKNIQWWYAIKIPNQKEGVEIEIINEVQTNFEEKISKVSESEFLHIKIVRLHLESKLGIDIIIDNIYTGTFQTSAKFPELPAWLESKSLKPIKKDDRVLVYLKFPDIVNIGDTAT